MIRNWQYIGALAAVVASAGLSSQVALAQADDEVYEEIVTIGTRSAKPRSARDSTVPIDVISGDEFNALGGTADLTDNIRALVPSYTATPATGDGSAFVRPTSLRGTASDQTLVLINGKRRHRSALVHFFAPAAGNGAHAVDVGMIPGIAVKSVEVLRDGAASQYGSDAIAGVINFVMKDAAEGGQVQVQYGEHYDGEQSVKVSANAGFGLSDSGFANVSFEYIDNDALIRAIQRPDAQALIDMGVSEVGQDVYAVDVGMIPGIAVKSVEVLRDGAASQYGSDAIAGVINFVMKDAAEGGQVQVQYGEHYDGEQSVKVSANAGFGLSDSGFANVSFEYIDNDALIRAIQRPLPASPCMTALKLLCCP